MGKVWHVVYYDGALLSSVDWFIHFLFFLLVVGVVVDLAWLNRLLLQRLIEGIMVAVLGPAV